MSIPFRNSAAFGKRIEFYVVGLMLREGLDVYLPLVDDHAIDAVIKRPDGRFVEVQIKARSKVVKFGDAALFSAMTHEHRPNYWFVFYSERMDTMWILSSREYLADCVQNKRGKNIGKRSIWFNGWKGEKEHVKPRYQRYVASTFQRIVNEDPDAVSDAE